MTRTIGGADDAAKVDATALERLRQFGGSRLIQGMILTFLDMAPERISAARRALAASDAVGVIEAAHALGSSARQLGAVGLEEFCREVEHRAANGEISTALIESLQDRLASASHWLRSALPGEPA